MSTKRVKSVVDQQKEYVMNQVVAPRLKEIDSEGYERLLAILEEKRSSFSDIQIQLAYVRDSEGANLLESSSINELRLEANNKLEEIRELEQELKKLIVVEFKANPEMIGFGDIVELEVQYAKDDIEVQSYKMVSSTPDPFMNELSKDSIIGSLIYGKKVGFSSKVTLPDGNTATVKILSKE